MLMTKLKSILGSGACLLAVGLMLPGQEGDTLRSYFGKPVVLDGTISRGEWADAAEFTGVKNWRAAFHPVTDDNDLSLRGFVKHDAEWLYFAFDVTDNILYGIETERFLPEANPKAHDLSREGYPWYGDEAEILIDTSDSAASRRAVLGNGSSWQMVCNLTKSRPGGIGVGGILEGEPRAVEAAWNTYQRWIQDGAMKCSAKKKDGNRGYVLEWAIRFNPCLESAPGSFYSPAAGPLKVRLKIALGDLDRPEDGAGNKFRFHHEQWFPPKPAGVHEDPAVRAPRPWGYLELMGRQQKDGSR